MARRQHRLQHRRERRAAILLVVVVMLGLFATVGLAFVYYASSKADSARIFREAENLPTASPLDPTEIANQSLGVLIFGTRDDTPEGVFCALRGHDFARDLYGWNYQYVAGPTTPILAVRQTGNPNTDGLPYNGIPFNGYGLIQNAPSPFTDPNGLFINYTYFPQDGFLRDPERMGQRSSPTDPFPGPFVAKNSPYTYPDLNNAYLAAIDARGRILVPSFHRSWMFGPLADPANPNWTNAAGKYLTLRPRPAEHSPQFPFPQTFTDPVTGITYEGDVSNLEPGSQKYDSIWIDLGFPVREQRGKTVKPLVAFLIIDVDGRVNVNVAGNRRELDPNTSQPITASHQGWGPWEVNPSRVFFPSSTLPDPDAHRREARQILLGNVPPFGTGTLLGRYGRDFQPTKFNNVMTALAGHSPKFYSQVDFDASTQTNPDPSNVVQYRLPDRFTSFPILPDPDNRSYPARYQNGNSTPAMDGERDYHPLLSNPYLLKATDPTGPAQDRIFSAAEIRYLNARFFGDTQSYTVNSELGQLAPINLGQSDYRTNPDTGGKNPRYLVTTLSNDLDRPGLPPWVLDSSATSTAPYELAPPTLTQHARPTGNPIPFAPGSPTGNADENPLTSATDIFNANEWRSIRALMGGVDLNRNLADYGDPAMPPSSANMGNVAQADQDRKQFAEDIYRRLLVVTGANPTADPTSNPNQYNALRYLAQLAVNIVDYIDSDDIITIFPWDPNDPTQFVYGTEMPRLVLNEVYAQINNDPMDPPDPNNPMASLPYRVNFWVELHNTFRTDPLNSTTLSDNADARLYDPNVPTPPYPGNPVYEIWITKPNITDPMTGASFLDDPTNVKGDPLPDPGMGALPHRVLHVRNYSSTAPTNPNIDPSVVKPWDPVNDPNATAVDPNGGNYMFSVLGPSEDDPTTGQINFPYDDGMGGAPPATHPNATIRVPNAPPAGNLPRHGLMYRVPLQDPVTMNNIDPNAIGGHDILLRRLANPHLPAQEDPAQPNYNPYITVDYLGNVPTQNGVEYDTNGAHAGLQPVTARAAAGKEQPFAAYTSFVKPQGVAPANSPKNTLFYHNNPLQQPFDWLIHLDRELVSPIELLHVSGMKPHELTQWFRRPGAPPYRYPAPWLDQDSRLYRALEVLRTKSRIEGIGLGGRIPGKININTIWDKEVFDALCDAQSGNYFDQAIVDQIWTAMTDPASPTARSPGLAGGLITPNDRPFGSFANPFTGTNPPRGPVDGINGTLLQFLNQTNAPNDPYAKHELVRKIHNSVTTRSNVFAVWMTVGYFEVVGESPTGQPILGAETFSDTPGDLRNQFFAIVDRTNISINPSDPTMRTQGKKPMFFPIPSDPALLDPTGSYVPAGTPVPIAVPATGGTPGVELTGESEGTPWTLRVGDQLIIESFTNAYQSANGYGPVSAPVTAVNPAGVNSSFTFIAPVDLRAGSLVSWSIAGNPGPQANFDFRSAPYTSVVPYWTQLR